MLFNSKRNCCFPIPGKIIPDNVCDDTFEKDGGDISDGFTDLFSSQSSYPAGQHAETGVRHSKAAGWISE